MISIVIPAYNEKERIFKSLDKIISYMKISYEIIVVDDGSSDDTFKKLREYKKQNSLKNMYILKNKVNKGKGYSVKKGMLFAKGDRILFTDADLSTPIEELDKLLKYKQDVVIGSRAMKGSKIKIKQPFYRVLMGKTFNLFVRLISVKGINDTQCGFKLFKKNTAKNIFSKVKIETFGFDVEALYLAKKYGFSIKEVPVVWINNEASKVSPIKDSLKMFSDLFRIRFNELVGKYNG